MRRVFLRPDERTVPPPNMLGMSLVARLSERSPGLLHATLALFLSLSIAGAQAQPADAAKGEAAKFKVFIAGAGYKYFGCEDSAAKGRKELLAKGAKAGKVQKVAGKVAI